MFCDAGTSFANKLRKNRHCLRSWGLRSSVALRMNCVAILLLLDRLALLAKVSCNDSSVSFAGFSVRRSFAHACF